MKLDAGIYKTRDGRKVSLLVENPHICGRWIGVFDGGNSQSAGVVREWSSDGRYSLSGEQDSCCDLVSEWRDPVSGYAWATFADERLMHVYPCKHSATDSLLGKNTRVGRIRYEEAPGDD